MGPAALVVLLSAVANSYLLSRGLIFDRFQSSGIDLAAAFDVLMPTSAPQIQPILPYEGFSPVDYIFDDSLVSDSAYFPNASRYLFAAILLIPGLGFVIQRRRSANGLNGRVLRNLLVSNLLTLGLALAAFSRLLPANQYAIFLVPSLVFSASVCVGMLPRNAQRALTAGVVVGFGGWFLLAPTWDYSNQTNDALRSTASVLASDDMVFVGNYWTITPLQFLSGDQLIAITAPERFPSDALIQDTSESINVTEVELISGPSTGAGYPLRSLCDWSDAATKVMEANLRMGVCPVSAVRLGMPRSFQG
jgi:hypothetical protein